jgi:hypothetical protein
MKTYGKWSYGFTLSEQRHQMEVSGQLHASAAFPHRNSPGTYWIGGWVGLSAGVEGRITYPYWE